MRNHFHTPSPSHDHLKLRKVKGRVQASFWALIRSLNHRMYERRILKVKVRPTERDTLEAPTTEVFPSAPFTQLATLALASNRSWRTSALSWYAARCKGVRTPLDFDPWGAPAVPLGAMLSSTSASLQNAGEKQRVTWIWCWSAAKT
jgi:hypothetical protein